MFHVIKSGRGRPVIMSCPQPDAQEIGRACSIENATQIADEYIQRIGGRRLAAATVLCAALVALVSGALL